MKGPQFALILAGVLLNAIAQLLLKAGSGTLAGVELRAANALVIAGRLLSSMPIIAVSTPAISIWAHRTSM